MKLSLGFGLRLRGLDLLTSLRVDDGSRDGDVGGVAAGGMWHRGLTVDRGGWKGRWCPSDVMAMATSYDGNRYSYIIDIMVY